MTTMTRRLGAAFAAASGAVVIAAAPASAHPLHAGTQTRDWAAVMGNSAFVAAILAATIGMCGLLWAPRLTGPPAAPGRWRAAALGAAFMAVTADLAALAGISRWPGAGVRGWPSALTAVHLVGAAVAAYRMRCRLPGPVDEALGAGMLSIVGLARSGGGEVAAAAVGVAHLFGATAWVGGAVAVALAPGPSERARAARHFSPYAAGAAFVTIATGVANFHIHLPVLDDLLLTGYGHLMVAKLAAVVAVTALGAVAFTRRRGTAAPPVRREAAILAVVVLLAAGLISFPSSGPAPSVPLLRTVRIAGTPVAVLISPNRPGPNLIHLSAPTTLLIETRLNDRLLPLSASPGETGKTGIVTLQKGAASLRLSVAGGHGVQLRWQVSDRTAPGAPLATTVALNADGECISRQLGEVVAVAEANARRASPYQLTAAAVPAGCATGEPAGSMVGDAYARFLSALGERAVVVVADQTSRSQEMAAALARRGAQVGLVVRSVDAAGPSPPAPVDAIVVTTSWTHAGATMANLVAAGAPLGGVFLAPWLLDGDLFDQTLGGGSALPQAVAADLHELVVDHTQLTVGATLDPTSEEARRYLAALARWAPGELPSGSGFAGYEDARAQMRAQQLPAPSGMQFFTPTRAAFLPPVLSVGHTDLPPGAEWIAGGTLAPVSAVVPLEVRAGSTTH